MENGILNQGEQRGQQELPPESQEQFDLFIINGMNIIHNEKASKSILNVISKSQDPIKAIAGETVKIVDRIATDAAKNGLALSNDVLVHGGNFLMGEIINVAETAGMQKMTDEEKSASFELATAQYLDESVKSGKVSPEQMAQLGQQARQSPEGQQIAQKMQQGQGVQNG